MKILLTGGTGFLGRALLAAFLAKNFTVIVTSRKAMDCAHPDADNLPYETCNTTLESLTAIFRKHPDIDVVVHAATDYGRSAQLPTSVFAGNVGFPIHLLELAMKSSVGLFVNVDTFFNTKGSEYQYLGEYTLSKRHFQEWGEMCARRGKLRFVNLRLFHLFGPGDGVEKFIPSVIERCLKGVSIDLTDGAQRRDFIYIDDAVGAILSTVESETDKPAAYVNYDIGSGCSHSIRILVEMIKHLSNSHSVLNFGTLKNRAGEFSDARADVAALKGIGLLPKTSLEEGLRRTIQSYRLHVGTGD